VRRTEGDLSDADGSAPRRYKNDPQITAMTSLVSAYQMRDVQMAERILKGLPSVTTKPADLSSFCHSKSSYHHQ